MSRYKVYGEYKDSGVEWLGAMPSHWKVVPLKRVCVLKTGLTPPTDNQENYVDEEYEFPWVRPEDLNENGLAVNATKYLSSTGWQSMRKISPYSTLICCIGTIGKIGYVENVVATNQQITAASFSYSPKYNFYLLQSARNVLEETATGNVIKILNSERLSGVKFLLIPCKEANAIANFLDHETAKIDTLIAKQQELIKLLKEKRQAVISHAVTKGLNPKAPMRDSGVEWLGEIPKHWEIRKFKSIFEIRKRIAGKLGYQVLSITQKGIKIKDTESGDGQLSMDYSKYQIVEKGDFAMNHMDLITGFVDISKFEGVTSPDYRVFALSEKNAVPEYYLYYLQMGYLNRIFFPFGQGAATIGRWRLPTEAFNEFPAPVPPKDEQHQLSDYILRTVARMELIEEKAIFAIQTMKERRTALISAAVTGKIDVRDWQPAPLPEREDVTA